MASQVINLRLSASFSSSEERVLQRGEKKKKRRRRGEQWLGLNHVTSLRRPGCSFNGSGAKRSSLRSDLGGPAARSDAS